MSGLPKHPISNQRMYLGKFFCIVVLLTTFINWGMDSWSVHAAPSPVGMGKDLKSSEPKTEYVILFILEGVGQKALSAGPMPTLQQFVDQGSVTWSAVNPTPRLRLPSVASLIMGVPVEKHGITWNEFDFARGYPRPATLFDYMDLSGGKDTAIFFMDESLYQLARPEPYIDYQMCGALRPECTSETVVKYIRDYFIKGVSGEGYGRRIFDLPHLLLVHLPEAGRIGQAQGWDSPEYQKALRSVDSAMHSVLDIYKEVKLFNRTTVFVTSLNSGGDQKQNEDGAATHVPWIAWGVGVKPGHAIQQQVSLLDTGATVMRTLGLETYTEWDSHSVDEVFVDPPPDTAQSRH